MIDEFEKYKHHIDVPEHKSVPFDLHRMSICEYKRKETKSEKFTYMKKYGGDGMIMDFYKNNSNILFIKNEQ